AIVPDPITTPEATPTPPAAPAVPAQPIRSATPPADDTAIADALTADRKRASDIESIGSQFGMPEEATRAAVKKGTSVDAFRKIVMDHMSSDEVNQTRARETQIGLTDGEVSQYSITNVVRFLMNPTDRTRERAAFEIEASRAVSDKLGAEPGGVFLPADVLMDGNFARNQNVGVAAAGGVLVAQDYRGGSFIEMLRNRMALSNVGVRVLQGLQGNVDIPKQTGGGTFYWFGEDGAPTDTAAEFGLVGMTPHSAGMAIPFTRRMAQQGSPDIEALVRDDLLKGLAIGIDRTALAGHPSPDAPNGLKDRIGGSATPWAGQFATYEELVDLETEVAVGNADVGSLGYIYDPRSSGHFKKTLEHEGVAGKIEQNGVVNGYRRVSTNQADEADVYFGNWNDLIIGMWSGMDLRVDTATKAASDGKVLRVFTDMDVAVRNTESFQMGGRA
ncbi:MAG: phage major capsid protein, partial [Pseudomonadota bacterium]